MSLSEMNNKIIKEFNISVPWGHIAVKTWGTQDDPHILMIHGTTDNAGSFDNLMPHLPNSFYYICIDLPGHGRSSHFPPSLPISSTDYLIVCKLVIDYFKQKKIILLGHSVGGQISYLFSRIYPELVDKMISLDALPFFPIEAKNAIKSLRKVIERNINIERDLKSKSPLSYEYDEVLEYMRNNRYRGEILTKEAVVPMLKRWLEPAGNGKYTVTTDERVKFRFDPLHDMRYILESLKYDPIMCPVLVIFATGNYFPREAHIGLLRHFKTLPNIKIAFVDGKHDVHNNNPTMVVPHLVNFLLMKNSKI